MHSSRASTVSPRTEQGIAVRFAGASKSFGSHCVLQHVDLEVPEGQKLVIIGPSGSGKTTILRCLMTLERLDAGMIEVDGVSLNYGHNVRGRRSDASLAEAAHEVRRRVGMVFQQFNLFPNMTASQNVALAPRHVLKRSKTVADAAAAELLAIVGLAAKKDAYPRELSGGQQQRVAIARALAMEPKVLLFDEVTSALDPEMVGEVTKVIRNVAATRSTTLIIVTHEMQFAADIADRVVLVDDGRIIEDGAPKTLFETPSKQRTREFLRLIRER